MFEKQKEELTFIEKKRQWKGDLEKPLAKRTLLTMLPALGVGVFLLMSAPYLKIIVQNAVDDGNELHLKPLNLEEAPEPKEKTLPPPSPEAELGQFYRDLYDKEGFDWRSKPVAPKQDMELAQEQPIRIAPIEIDIPLTSSQLDKLSN